MPSPTTHIHFFMVFVVLRVLALWGCQLLSLWESAVIGDGFDIEGLVGALVASEAKTEST